MKQLKRSVMVILCVLLVGSPVLVASLILNLESSNSESDKSAKLAFAQKYDQASLDYSISEIERVIGLRHGPVRYDMDDTPRTIKSEFLPDHRPKDWSNHYFQGDNGIIIYFDYDTERVTGKELIRIEHKRNPTRAVNEALILRPLKLVGIW